MNQFFNDLKADLTDRRLMPLVALVVIAVVAAVGWALFSGGSSSSTSTVHAIVLPAGPAPGLATTTVTPEKAVAETASGYAAQRHGASRNPFAPLPGSAGRHHSFKLVLDRDRGQHEGLGFNLVLLDLVVLDQQLGLDDAGETGRSQEIKDRLPRRRPVRGGSRGHDAGQRPADGVREPEAIHAAPGSQEPDARLPRRDAGQERERDLHSRRRSDPAR